ncbi:hypothetical protein CRG98_004421 [Punica granatum]|uniref:Uncharacterized protein n=1 Tax=Punica granatum TaxID=22663 RepID=A0A2I0L3B4_PUNGR|nr:hypothetical protein CRG98_004421 [Punica granatum]
MRASWRVSALEVDECVLPRACCYLMLMVALRAHGLLGRFCVQLRRGYLHVEPLPCQSMRWEAREEFSDGRDPAHRSSPAICVSREG